MAESYPAPYHPPWSAGYPSRPLCSDDLAEHGLWRAPLRDALMQPYIQPNPARRVWVIVLDVDRPGAAVDWQSAAIPPPNWTTTSRASGHAHLAYVLAAPVAISDAARIAPLRLLARVQRALVAVTEADRGYSGLVTQTPHHPRWITVIWHQQPYDLAELCDYLPDSALALADQTNSLVEQQQGVGRNVTLFDRLRRWAYRSRGSFADADAWRNACLAKAVELAHELGGEVLPLSEVRAIARSVAKWTWRRLDVQASAERFAALQSRRGQAAGVTHASARFDRMAALLSDLSIPTQPE